MTAPIAHGTYAGYVAHMKREGKRFDCTPCRDARREYFNDWRRKDKAAKEAQVKFLERIEVPWNLLAELYLNASPDIQVLAERRLGKHAVNLLIDRYDQENPPAPVVTGVKASRRWTKVETNVAVNRELTVKQAAEMLGRTPIAVQNRRRRATAA